MLSNFISEPQNRLSRNATQSTRRLSTRRIPTLQPACLLIFGVLRTKEKTPKLSGTFSRSAAPMPADLDVVIFV